ncbi:MAG: MoaD/ThiS family protein [Magnetovibrionaceae bacterium]
MKITIKLYALLSQHLPDHAVKNEAEIEVDDRITPMGVMESLRLPLEFCHLVLVNGVYVSPGERDEKELAEGDALAIWPPVAGG